MAEAFSVLKSHSVETGIIILNGLQLVPETLIALSRFTFPQKLDLQCCNLTEGEFDCVPFLTSVKVLYVGDNNIRWTDVLASRFPNLTTLDLSDNQIARPEHLDALADMKDLVAMDIRGNPIEYHPDFQSIFFFSFTNVKKWKLDEPITDFFDLLKSVTNMAYLSRLMPAYNYIKTLDEDETVIILDGRTVDSVAWEELQRFPDLEKLSANACAISNLVGFVSLPKLRVLILNDNCIGDVDAIVEGCPNLERLSLANNDICYEAQLKPLAQLEKLVALDIERNDVCNLRTHEAFMQRTFPKVTCWFIESLSSESEESEVSENDTLEYGKNQKMHTFILGDSSEDDSEDGFGTGPHCLV